eukprot:TRINITY_DN1618_c0_g1_i7.p1 TRINITY_DN1618_c0_g1~~TRINITY_DN1618_c0_g1_i7.p1  ORF type:complete len:324 (-),score=88.23 TRINITY_DN1618_c0_g1_i7:91-1062(-)
MSLSRGSTPISTDRSDRTTTKETDANLQRSESHSPQREAIADGLSQLGRTADGKNYAYLSLSLPGKELSDLTPIERYPHLQIIDLENNEIQSLRPLANLKALVFLNVARNKISEIHVKDELPLDLRDLNLSFNKLQSVKGFGALRFLNHLYLDDNKVSILHELETLAHLKIFSIRNNALSNLEGLEGLPLKELYLSGNQIETIYQLTQLKKLEVLDLSSNLLPSIAGLENLTQLQTLNLSSNQISNLDEVCALSKISLLRKIDLTSNPVQSSKDYRNHVVTSLISLSTLDRVHVTAEEKVAALNSFHPPKLFTLADLPPGPTL